MIITPAFKNSGAHLVLSMILSAFVTNICPKYADDQKVTLMIMSGGNGTHDDGFMIYRSLGDGEIEPLYTVKLYSDKACVCVIVGLNATLTIDCPANFIFVKPLTINNQDMTAEEHEVLDEVVRLVAETLDNIIASADVAEIENIRFDHTAIERFCSGTQTNDDNTTDSEDQE